ncbi:MAG: FAD-binding oxidoreductase [Chloroflexi bacterium]|nr:FAD-binding oxidoreductase [Chloroflexota bacterium]
MAEKDELVKIVGAENVTDDPKILEEYSRDMSFTAPGATQYVVKPKNVGEVQALVKLANTTSTPLVAVSSGPPRFRGDTIPRYGGVVVDLSDMKRIINIDRGNRVVMIEPGVRFGELQEAAKKEGMRVPVPLCPRSSKSVIGSMLEREPHIIPKYHLDMCDPLLCLEIIFGTGDLFHTGEAAGPGTIEEQWQVGRHQKDPMGPSMVGYAKLVQGSQGTLGIVTWATVRCEVLPQIQKPFLVASDRIEALIDFAYRILRLRLGDECLLLNSSNLASILTNNGRDVEALRGILPPWVLLVTIAGYEWLPEERIEYQEKDTMEVARQFGVQPLPAVPGAWAWEVLRSLSQPSEEPYWKLRHKGGCQDIFFITTLNKTPEFIRAMHGVAQEKGYPVTDMGVYIQPVSQGHGCHCEFNLTYDPSSPEERARIQDLFSSASETVMRMGGFFSRPYGSWADIVYNRDAATRDALVKIKGIFDPNGILNPGKLCF